LNLAEVFFAFYKRLWQAGTLALQSFSLFILERCLFSSRLFHQIFRRRHSGSINRAVKANDCGQKRQVYAVVKTPKPKPVNQKTLFSKPT
jgi:hypothetical protein